MRGSGGIYASAGGGVKVLHLHFDGADESTTFVDSSAYAHTPAATYSDPKIDSARSKFGGTSGHFDGNDGLRYGAQSEYALGLGDFTVDAWVNPGTVAVGSSIWIEFATDWAIGFDGNLSSDRFILYQISSGYKITGGSMSADTWQHAALTRKDGVFRLFDNGVLAGSYTAEHDLGISGSRPIVGCINGQFSPWNGWIDELRILKGYAAWTSNFTPPDAPYP